MISDFTLDQYVKFCLTIHELGYEFMTLAKFIKTGQPKRRVLILRHDVDRSVNRALRMAEIESSLGIKSTYYLRTTRSVFKPEALVLLHELGHEVGYHYEVLASAKGSIGKAILMFERELEMFRHVVPVETVSMHGSPLSPWNNLYIWKSMELSSFRLIGEAYLSIDYKNIYYFTDTGRSWNSQRYNFRDKVDSLQPEFPIFSTPDLIAFLCKCPKTPVLINAHPNRWSSNLMELVMSLSSDWIINQAKRVVSFNRVRH
jgi:hypothetical protein